MATENPVSGIATPEMLNAIRAGASQTYKDSVPIATPYNLQEVGNPIFTYKPVANEFLDVLVNKIIMQTVDKRMWDNPLGILRTGEMPLGMDIEHIQVNPAEAEEYDGTETGMADILKIKKPDVVTVYFRLNRHDKYKVTISNQQLRGAFTAWCKLEELIAAITDSLYNGNTIDEYRYTKQLVTDAVQKGIITTIQVPAITSEATGKQFMTRLRSLSPLFTFPSDKYNNYKLAGGPGNPRITWVPIDEQIIMITAEVAATVGVEVLSTLFNVSYADYLARQIIVDDFGDTGVQCLLADRRAFVIYQQMREFATFFNPSTLGWQYYYHAWDMFALDPTKNCVALSINPPVTPPVPDPDPETP